jgi:hypothetical protein
MAFLLLLNDLKGLASHLLFFIEDLFAFFLHFLLELLILLSHFLKILFGLFGFWVVDRPVVIVSLEQT